MLLDKLDAITNENFISPRNRWAPVKCPPPKLPELKPRLSNNLSTNTSSNSIIYSKTRLNALISPTEKKTDLLDDLLSARIPKVSSKNLPDVFNSNMSSTKRQIK
jgi:hypothetical protein